MPRSTFVGARLTPGGIYIKSLWCAALVLLASVPVAAQERPSRARTIADSAGTITGQASACGVGTDRVKQIGGIVLSAIERTATGGRGDERSAVELYATAIMEGGRRQRENSTGLSCSEVLRAFAKVEDMLGAGK